MNQEEILSKRIFSEYLKSENNRRFERFVKSANGDHLDPRRGPRLERDRHRERIRSPQHVRRHLVDDAQQVGRAVRRGRS